MVISITIYLMVFIFHSYQFFISLQSRSKLSSLLVRTSFFSESFSRNAIRAYLRFIKILAIVININPYIFGFSHDCLPPILVHNLESIRLSFLVHALSVYYYKMDTLFVP